MDLQARASVEAVEITGFHKIEHQGLPRAENHTDQATPPENQFSYVFHKTRITPPSGESSPNGEKQ
jgi:hypothetical protein